ncbi:hypothetical protein [Pseudomonas sp. B21-021]|uniref:hypothetical protein n=1 Tax=Pseudomonas sp. B21-021 TaxID=2895476 RepID=UPI0021605E2C|nr:hypothetical protein [Pseudomonas sp. B21-021]UVM30063.1 hypothetical protein LOY31_13675 [Pseudomonas sp. B21-021]
MPSSTPPSQSMLVLFPARIPLATAPIIGAHYGVLRAIYDLMPKGCEVVADAFLGQQQGDEVRLNLNGQTNIARATTQGTSDSVKLYIPHGLLIPGIVNRLTYTVIRGSSNQGTSEPPVEIIYNKEGPGEQDVTPGDGANSSLKLLLPKEITDGVGPGFTEAIVCVEYAWCRAYDHIRLNCNGHDVFHTVTENQAPPPPAHGSATPTRICFKVTSADLKDDPEFMFSFTVNDQLKNGPDSDAPWSAVEKVVVDQAGTLLAAPIPREIPSDTSDDKTTISLKKLGANPLSLIILTQHQRFEAGDTIKAKYITRLDGVPDEITDATGVVEEDELGQKKACVLKIPNEKVIPKSTALMTYELFRNNVSQGTSRIASAIVEAFVPLSVDTSLLRLKGLKVVGSYLGTPNGVDAIDTTATRLPVGGVEPYTFESTSNAFQAAADGKVTAVWNGTGEIVIRDKVGSEVRYSAHAENIHALRVFHGGYPWTYPKYSAWINQNGHFGLTANLRAVLQRCYSYPWIKWDQPQHPEAWTGAAAGEVYNDTSKTFYTADINSSKDYGLGFYKVPAIPDTGSMGAMGIEEQDQDMSIIQAPLPE